MFHQGQTACLLLEIIVDVSEDTEPVQLNSQRVKTMDMDQNVHSLCLAVQLSVGEYEDDSL